MLALFIEVAAFEPERPGGLRDLAAVPLELGKHLGALEGQDALN